MKRIASLLMAAALLMAFSVSVFAVPKNFVVSPGGHDDPVIIEFIADDGVCTAKYRLKTFLDRFELTDGARAVFEESYETIVKADQLVDVVRGLRAKADKLGIPVDRLAVSELFDMEIYDCDTCHGHDEHMYYIITLTAESLSGYVGLMRYLEEEDTWEVMDNAELIKNGTALRFEMDEFHPLGIVVNTEEYNPKTGDEGISPLWFILLGVSAAGLVTVGIIYMKKRRDEGYED